MKKSTSPRRTEEEVTSEEPREEGAGEGGNLGQEVRREEVQRQGVRAKKSSAKPRGQAPPQEVVYEEGHHVERGREADR